MDENIDSTEYKKSTWDKEYSTRKNLPSSNTYYPSRLLKSFLEEHGDINKEYALDLGSGNGRNSIFLAGQGFKKVLGVEFSHEAISQAENKVQELGLNDRVIMLEQSLGQEIPEINESFDLIIDMMVMHSLNADDRVVMINEVKRLLKPGGYFIFYTIAADSPAAVDLIKKDPGPERNSYRFKVENDTITEKAFTQEELEELFHPLKLVEIKRDTQFTPAFGDIFERVYLSVIMQK